MANGADFDANYFILLLHKFLNRFLKECLPLWSIAFLMDSIAVQFMDWVHTLLIIQSNV